MSSSGRAHGLVWRRQVVKWNKYLICWSSWIAAWSFQLSYLVGLAQRVVCYAEVVLADFADGLRVPLLGTTASAVLHAGRWW